MSVMSQYFQRDYLTIDEGISELFQVYFKSYPFERHQVSINTNIGELSVHEIDGINRRKWEFSIKKPLEKLAKMTKHEYLEKYYFKSEIEPEDWELDELGYEDEDEDEDED